MDGQRYLTMVQYTNGSFVINDYLSTQIGAGIVLAYDGDNWPEEFAKADRGCRSTSLS